MSQRVYEVLMPTYLKQFSCIGPACEETCCKGWNIEVDKKTFKSYRNCKVGTLCKDINLHIKRNKHSTNDHNYASIKLKDGTCPMLGEDMLCRIHKEMGEKQLSSTCYFYPKLFKQVDNRVEAVLSPSCPEVGRIMLFDSEPMAFVSEQVTFERDVPFTYIVGGVGDFDPETDLKHYLWELRIFTISLLQDRRYTLDERMILLGYFINKLTQTTECRLVPKVIENCQSLFDDVTGMKAAIGEQTQVHYPGTLIGQIVQVDVLKNFPSERYFECVIDLYKGLEIENADDERSKVLYFNAYDSYYKTYFDTREYILENYLVNEVFKELYPFAKLNSPSVSYRMLSMLYTVLKMHLVGVSSHHKKLDDALVLKTIQTFSRVVIHHKNYMDLFMEIPNEE